MNKIVTWLLPDEDGVFRYRGKRVKPARTGTVAIVGVIDGDEFSAREEILKELIPVTVTIDNTGKCVVASMNAPKLVGKLFVGELESTMFFDMPAEVINYDGYDIQLMQYVPMCWFGSSEFDCPVYTYGVRDGKSVITFGGLRSYPEKFNSGSGMCCVSNGEVSILDGACREVDLLYTGDTMIVPGTGIRVGILEEELTVGYTYTVDVYESIPTDVECILYPYSPTGMKRYRVKKEAQVDNSLIYRVENELAACASNGNLSQLVAVVGDVLSDAPSSFKESDSPVFAALSWSLAKCRGGV